MIYNTFIFNCNGNGCEERGEFTNMKEARRTGWGIAPDNNTCLCPKCMAKERIKANFKIKFK